VPGEKMDDCAPCDSVIVEPPWPFDDLADSEHGAQPDEQWFDAHKDGAIRFSLTY